MPPKAKDEVRHCRNGPACSFLKRPGGCMYYHPASHIPCKNGADCPFLKKSGGCRFRHEAPRAPAVPRAVPERQVSHAPLFVCIRGLAGKIVDTTARGDGPVCAYGCGKTDDLKWEVCPYRAEIYETDVWAWRCEECMHEAAMDI